MAIASCCSFLDSLGCPLKPTAHFTHTYVYIYIYLFIYFFMCVYIYIYICMYIICIHICEYMHVYIYMYAYTFIYLYVVYVYMYAYITCMYVRSGTGSRAGQRLRQRGHHLILLVLIRTPMLLAGLLSRNLI